MVGAPAPVESLGYAHNVLLVSGAGVAHEVVGLDHRRCPSQTLRAERHDNEAPRRQRRRVDDTDAFKHLHVGLGVIEVSPREPIRPLRRGEHGDALLAVFILDIVEAPAPRLSIRRAPRADDVETFFGLHAPPPGCGAGAPLRIPRPGGFSTRGLPTAHRPSRRPRRILASPSRRDAALERIPPQLEASSDAWRGPESGAEGTEVRRRTTGPSRAPRVRARVVA